MKKLILVLVTLCIAANAFSYEFLLGTVRLKDDARPDGSIFHDISEKNLIQLSRCRYSSNQPVNFLRIEVLDYAAFIDRLGVEYQNGERQELQVRDQFAAFSTSRVIPLNGYNPRCVAKIFVKGHTNTGWTDSNLYQARVRIFGY